MNQNQQKVMRLLLTARGQMDAVIRMMEEGRYCVDISNQLLAIDALIRKGHTIVVVEHNMDVIKCADWVIDLGPEAGDRGGRVVFEGTPAQLETCAESYTGQFLKLRTKL